MKKSILAALITCAIALSACNNSPKTEEHKTVIIDTIVKKDTVKQTKSKPEPSTKQVPSTEKKTPPAQQPVTKLPPKKAADWRAMMKEYHLLLCKSHNGTGTTDDNIRKVELSKELKDIPKTLDGDEKFYFTTEMARTLNMETCQ